ncbi:MAG: ABC transporter substrate-binding protein [Fimbriimonadaceae bacterium]|nr:ABC transporter substrate-binding protein [Fimbriimonadaceae bacterium]
MVNRSLFPALGLIGVAATAWYSERLTTPEVRPGPVRITYWEKWTGFEGDAMRAVVDEFNRSQDEIFVELLTVSGIQDKTLLATSGGNPPDVAGLFGPNVAQYADNMAVMPLTEFCKEAGIGPEDYIPCYWDIGFYKGEVYSLPTTPASTALHYNRALLKAAGLDPDRPPKTIEELDAYAEKLTKRNGSRIEVSGFLPNEPGWWNWSWGYFFGGTLLEGDTITANSPENIRAYEWIQSYTKKFGAGDIQAFRSGFGNFSSPQNPFMSQKVAMVLQGVWMYNFISQFAPELDWAAAPFPHPADRPDLAEPTLVDLDVLVIPVGAKHPKEAFEFIKFVQSQKGMELLCMGQRKHSPLREVSQGFYENHPNPYIRLFTELAYSKNAISAPKIGIWPEYQAELNSAFDEVYLMRKTPKEALDYVQARMTPLWEDYLLKQRLREQR